jgi:hypothetical protein
MQSHDDAVPAQPTTPTSDSAPVATAPVAKKNYRYVVLPADYNPAVLATLPYNTEFVFLKNNTTGALELNFFKKKGNNRWLNVVDVQEEAKIIPEMSTLANDLPSIKATDLSGAEANADTQDKVEGLLKGYAKSVRSRNNVLEIVSAENDMRDSLRVFVDRMNTVLKSPVLTETQKEEFNVYLEPYRKLADSQVFAGLNLDVKDATSFDEQIVKMAQIVADAFATSKDNAVVLNDALRANIEVCGEAIKVYDNFSKLTGKESGIALEEKFPTQPGQLSFISSMIIPVQHSMRYETLASALVDALNDMRKKNNITGPLSNQIDTIIAQLAAVKPVVLAANEEKRKTEALQGNIRTQNVVGVIMHEGLSIYEDLSGSIKNLPPSPQLPVWEQFLQKLNTIGNEMVKTGQTLGVPTPDGSVTSGRIKFYEPLMDAFVDSYLSHKRDGVGLTSAMLTLIKNSDAKLRSEGLSGIVYNEKVKKIPYTPMIKTVFATMRTADPAVIDHVVTVLFDKIKTMLESAPKGQANSDHELAYYNAFAAIRMMGSEAIKAWNKNAAEKFYDLAIVSTVPNSIEFKPLEYKNIIMVEKTEQARMQVLYDAAVKAASNNITVEVALKQIAHATPQQLRENVLAVILENYQNAYLDGRSKRFRATVKNDKLLAMESYIEQVDKTLAAHGQRGILGRDIDARGKANREEIILPAALALRPEQFHKSIQNLYARAKSAVTSASSNVAYVFVNAFKILERMTGQSPKTEWDKINKADASPNANLLALTESELSGKIYEEIVMGRYNTFSNITVSPESPVSPAASSDPTPASADARDSVTQELELDSPVTPHTPRPSDDDDEDKLEISQIRLDSPRSRSESVATAPTREAAETIVAKAELRAGKPELAQVLTKDILGKIANELALKRSIAVKYGFNQVKLWDDFSRQVSDITNNMIKSGETFNAAKFYATFMQTFMDGYLIHEKGHNDLFSEGIRDFVEKIDKYLHDFGLKGVIYKSPADMPGTSDKDTPALKSMGGRQDDFQSKMVNQLFDNVQKYIAGKVHAKFEERILQRTVDAINVLGPVAVAEWNKRAAMDFQELHIANGKVNLTYTELVKVGGTESVRRQSLLAILKMGLTTVEREIAQNNSQNTKLITEATAAAEQKAASKKTPDERKAAMQKALDNNKDLQTAIKHQASSEIILPAIQQAKEKLEKIIEKPGPRSAMIEEFKFTLLELFAHGYMEGRVREDTTFAHATVRYPALQALEKFIIGIETGFEASKQQRLFVDSPADFKPINAARITGKYVMAEIMFESANKLNPENFTKLIQSLLDKVKLRLDSQQVYVNTYKILERIGPDAKEKWNELVKADENKVLQGKLLIEDTKAELKESALEKRYDRLFMQEPSAAHSSAALFSHPKHPAPVQTAELKVTPNKDGPQPPKSPHS